MEADREALPETVEVRPAHRFETSALEKLLAARLGAKLNGMAQMRGGQSNPTFLLITDAGEFVLRKQPPGALLASAHAVDREYRILSALTLTDVPVPKPLFFCEDSNVVGTPFYVMERLKGRVFWSPLLEDAGLEERGPIYFGMASALAALHSVDWKALDLQSHGRPGSYFSRQIARWTRQWDSSRTRDNASIDKLAAWLPRNIPPGEDETTIVHGDFRLDNMMFDASAPQVIGILDWELSTLGHPLADLAYNCVRYRLDASLYNGLMGVDLRALGLPSEDEYVARYSALTGRTDTLTPFHFAFALFRIAVILEGVRARALAGNASNTDALKIGSTGIALADRGWEIAMEQ